MTMPLMPGLVGEENEGGGDAGGGGGIEALVAMLDELDDATFQALADELGGGGEAEAAPEGEAPTEGESPAPVEGEAPAEGEMAEGEEGEVDLAPVETDANASVEEVGAGLSQLESMLEQAKENEDAGADVKSVEELVSLAEDEQKNVEDAAKECADYAKKGDVEGATECGITARRSAEKVAHFVEQAKGLVGPTKPGKDSEDSEAEAMSIWSERVMGGG